MGDEGLFEKRVRFAALPARRHGARGEVLSVIDELVEYVLRYKRLSRSIRVGSRRVDTEMLAREALARKGRKKGKR